MINRRKRIMLIVCAAILVILSMILLSFVSFNKLINEQNIRVALKPKGNYEAVINQICEKLSDESINEKRGYCLKMKNIVSEGSRQTINQITTDSVDIGIIQGNAPLRGDYCGVIAELYDETYLLLSNTSLLSTISDIESFVKSKGRRVKIGCLGKGSQSLVDLGVILEYYGIDGNLTEVLALDYDRSADSLLRGSIDIAFYITGTQNSHIKLLSKDKNVVYVTLPDVEGLVKQFKNVELKQLLKGEISYNFPRMNVTTLSTPAVLIGTIKTNNISVYDITASLFSHKHEIESGISYLRIDTPSTRLNFPLHPGAVSYFHQTSPFYVEYSDLSQLAVSVFGAILGVLGLVVEVVKLRKDSTSSTATDKQ